MYIIQSSPVNPFKQQPAFLRLAAISPLCLYLQESGGYMAAESPLEAKIQISSFGKNPIWVRERGPTLRGHHTCPSSRMTTLSGGIDSPWRALQNTKVSAENDFSPQVGFFIEVHVHQAARIPKGGLGGFRVRHCLLLPSWLKHLACALWH